MGLWLRTLMEATFDGPPFIEGFNDGVGDETTPFCFEEAVVMRHNEGGMSRERRMEVYDLMRCRARIYCNVSTVRARNGTVPEIGLTLFMRSGPRSFYNESVVIGIFGRECAKVEGCRLMVAHSNNLTFCEQVSTFSTAFFFFGSINKKVVLTKLSENGVSFLLSTSIQFTKLS